MDVKGVPDIPKLKVIRWGIKTTTGVGIRFAPSREFLNVVQICGVCFKPNSERCFCSTQEERDAKRKNMSKHGEGKKKAALAHLASSFRE